VTEESFQTIANQQGSDFEKYAALWLRFNGWTVVDVQTRRHGVTIDIEAIDPNGVLHMIECKGADGTSKRSPGLADGTTVKVCIGVAYHLQAEGLEYPYTVITSHLPNDGTLAHRMIERAKELGAITQVIRPA